MADEKHVNKRMWVLSTLRLVDLYTRKLNNPDRARELLQRQIERYPGTKESVQAEIWLFSPAINGKDSDSYHEVRIEEDTYSNVNRRLVEQWILNEYVDERTLIMNDDSGKWDLLKDRPDFAATYRELVFIQRTNEKA